MDSQTHCADAQPDTAITDPFWQHYQQLIKEVVVPYQWQALNDQIADAEPSHAIANFRIAAGQQAGDFYGMVFQDSDVAKWLEAVAYLLGQQPDTELEQTADDVIALVAAAQQPDGYLNTYFTVKDPARRWADLAECHELYCAGHFIEAAVAYYANTGKRQLLDVVCRFADLIGQVFGPGPEQIHGYPGHPEIELALTKLYEVTEQHRYLDLAQYFINERGQAAPHFYDVEYEQRDHYCYWDASDAPRMIKDRAYSQAHQPITEQSVAVGHAVRFVYLFTGVAHLANLTGEQRYIDACQRLWEDVTQRQMYITGAIGSQSSGEAFTCDYDLPNDTAYTETCASIGLIMFARRMIQLSPQAQYADVMERALYNTVLAGMAQDGKHFFYVNPLEVEPNAVAANHIYDHVKVTRQQWFGCACCPPNLARLIASIGQYIYHIQDNKVFVNLYVGNDSTLPLTTGDLQLSLRSALPWHGELSIAVNNTQPLLATLALRKPQWADEMLIELNGESIPSGIDEQGYCLVERTWQQGDQLTVNFAMPVRRVYAHNRVRHLAGQVALQRGPLVYCLEQADNGPQLHNRSLPDDADIKVVTGTRGVLADKQILVAQGMNTPVMETGQALYHFDAAPVIAEPCELTFIPYFTWANRGEGEMRVWVRR